MEERGVRQWLRVEAGVRGTESNLVTVRASRGLEIIKRARPGERVGLYFRVSQRNAARRRVELLYRCQIP